MSLTPKDDVIIVEIQGLSVDGEIARFCFPCVPDYGEALDEYLTGLMMAPSGAGSRWDVLDDRLSTGTYRLSFDPDCGFAWLQTRPRPLDQTTAAIAASASSPLGIQHERTGAAIGLAAGDQIVIDQETFDVTDPGSATTAIVVNRAIADTEAADHEIGSFIWPVPPSLTGRRVTVIRGPRVGGDTGDEEVELRGFIADEVDADLWDAHLEVVERFGQAIFNRDKRPWYGTGGVANFGDGAVAAGEVFFLPHTPLDEPTDGWSDSDLAAYYNDDGAYWYVEDMDAVFAIGKTAAGRGGWDGARQLIVSPNRDPGDTRQGLTAYQVICSDSTLPYPTLGRTADPAGTPAFEATDNAIDFILNFLVSTEDGDNYTAGAGYSWDRGTKLWPHFSLGVDESLIDWDAFAVARSEFELVRADLLWLGGPDEVGVENLFEELVAFAGFAIGTKRDGTWTCVRIGDVYPTDDVITIDSDDIIGIGQTMPAEGRALDSVLLKTNPGPDGKHQLSIEINELTYRKFYPTQAGAQERYEIPYTRDQFTDEQDASTFVAARVRRYADRLQFVEFDINENHFLEVDAGTPVEIHDLSFRDPSTGDLLEATDDALKGQITSVSGCDYYERTCRIRVVLTDSFDELRTFPPMAMVQSWASSTKIATCYSQQVTVQGDDDVERFTVGDCVMLLDADGTLRSDDGTSQTLPVVDAIPSSTTLDIDVDFVDAGGSPVTPADGDWIVPATWDGGATTSQKASSAFAADGGPGTSSPVPGLGSTPDSAHVFGDPAGTGDATIVAPVAVSWTSFDQQTVLDDWPWIFWRQIRDNLEHAKNERPLKAGFGFKADKAQRWCSLWPVPWGICWLHVPSQAREVTVRLRVEGVDFDDESAGVDAISLYATGIRQDGVYQLPPQEREDWIAPAGVTLDKTTTAETVELTAAIQGGGKGWLGVLVWTWSFVRETEESLAQIVGQNFGNNVISLALEPPSDIAERAFRVYDRGSTDAKGNAGPTAGTNYQVCHVRVLSTVTQYALEPPPFPLMGDNYATQASVHSMGVAEISGIQVECAPLGPPLPGQLLFEPGRPVSWLTGASLVSAVNQLVRTRVPTYSCHPRSQQRDQQSLWTMRGFDLDIDDRVGADNGDDTDYVTLDRAVVRAAIPDSNGYTAIASLYAILWDNWSTHDIAGLVPTAMYLRLAAYTVGASPSLIVAGDDTAYSFMPSGRDAMYEPRPVTAAIRGVGMWDHWQWRGALAGRSDDWGYSLRSPTLHHLICEIDETSITYPCQLCLEARLHVDRSWAVANLGSGIASRVKQGVSS